MWMILVILKWIGIILGGILGLLLFFGALILLVPVRYRVDGRSYDERSYSFKFSWLLSIVSVQKKMQSEKIVLKLFGIPIKCLAGGKTKPKKRTKEKENREDKPQKKKKATFTKEDEKKKRKKKKGFSFGRVSSIIGLVKDTGNRCVVGRFFHEFRLLVRYLAPKKIKGTMIVGTGDPCTTGLLFGGISLFPIVYEDDVQITPDFEEKRFEAEGSIKGRLRVIYFMRLVLRLYQDRDLKRLWKQINKVKKEAA